MRSRAWRCLETCCPIGALGWMSAVVFSVAVVPFAISRAQPVVTIPSVTVRGSMPTIGEWTEDPRINPTTPHTTVFPRNSVKPTEAITTAPMTQAHTSRLESSLTSASDTSPFVTSNPSTHALTSKTSTRQTVSAQTGSTTVRAAAVSTTSILPTTDTVTHQPATLNTSNTPDKPVTTLHPAFPTSAPSTSRVAIPTLPLTSAVHTGASTAYQNTSTQTPTSSSTPLPAHPSSPTSGVVTTPSYATPASLMSMPTVLPSRTTAHVQASAPPKTTTGLAVSTAIAPSSPSNGQETSTTLIIGQQGGPNGLVTSTPRPIIGLTSEKSSSPAQDQTYGSESTLIALLTAVCSVTGVVVLLLLVYLIKKQNRKWKRQRAAQPRRRLGVVNQTFFNADMIIEEENRRAEHAQRQDMHGEQLDGALVAQAQSFRDPDDFDVRNPTSEYSSSVESLSAPLNGQAGSGNREPSVAGQPRGTSPAAARWRAMTDDSGYEQGQKEDPWDCGAPRFDAKPGLPITTQHVYTNINSESDLDLTSGRVIDPPIPFVELATPAHPDIGDFPKATNLGKYDCQPVVNADGIIVRTARFPSKTSSQLSNSDHDSDRLLAQSSH